MTRTPVLGLAALVLAVFALYAGAGATIDAPRAFSDELLYVEAGGSLADGDGLHIREAPYQYGPLFPVAVAAAVAVTGDLEGAWVAMKLLNALLFALAAVPVFLLARRLLEPWPAVAVAALSVSIPSAIYVSVVMTESLAYLAATWALYALVRVFERPTWRAQIGALAAIGIAAAVRTQFAVLIGACLLGLVLVTLLVPGRLQAPAKLARTFMPVGLVAAAGAAVWIVGPLVRGDPPSRIGGYASLWRSYDPFEVLRWLVYHLANLELYLAVVPLAVAPIVLAALWRRARAGEEREAAFLAVFVAVNAAFLVLVAAFNTTIWAGERLHDRPLFYVVPLWLVLLFVWLRDGLPRPLVATGTGAALAVLLPLTLPLPDYVWNDFGLQHNAAASALWVEVSEGLAPAGLSVLAAFLVVSLLGVALILVTPARFWPVFPLLVAAVLGLSAAAAWVSAERTASAWAATLRHGPRTWIDDHVPERRAVTLLTAIGRCSRLDATRAPYLAEIFNRSVGPVAHLRLSPDYLPAADARVTGNGSVFVDGAALRASYVVAPAALGVDGTRVAQGSSVPLLLTRVDGLVRLEGSSWRRELRRRCP